jgi:hypothetical protein
VWSSEKEECALLSVCAPPPHTHALTTSSTHCRRDEQARQSTTARGETQSLHSNKRKVFHLAFATRPTRKAPAHRCHGVGARMARRNDTQSTCHIHTHTDTLQKD